MLLHVPSQYLDVSCRSVVGFITCGRLQLDRLPQLTAATFIDSDTSLTFDHKGYFIILIRNKKLKGFIIVLL